MPPKQVFPPPLKRHSTGQARCWWASAWHYFGAADTPASQAAYATFLYRIATGDPALVPPVVATIPLTVADVAAAWMEGGTLELTERGREIEAFRLTLPPLLRLWGKLAASTFGAQHLIELRQAMVSGSWMTDEERQHPQRRGKVGWSRQLVNQRIGRVKRIWQWAELVRMVPVGSYAALAAVRPLRENARGTRENRKRQGPPWDVYKRVARCCPPVVRSLLIVAWWTGARPGELMSMRAGDVDLANGVYRPRQHKTDYLGHAREIALGPKALAALTPWLRKAAGPESIVFPPSRRRTAEAYDRHTLAQVIQRGCERAGVEKGSVTSYLARHAAKERIERREGIEAARQVLGHRSVSTTARYGRPVDHDHARDVQRRIG
jgi:integrase